MRLYAIPEIDNIEAWVEISREYGVAFEYNDFFNTKLLDSPEELERVIQTYEGLRRDRSADTLHGVFLDMVVGSTDEKINAISMERMRGSLEIAKRLGLRAVIFHTNYVTNLKLTSYREHWLDANEITFTRFAKEYPMLDIYMENMFDTNPNLLLQLAKRMQKVENFGVCLDLAHAYLSEVPAKEWLKVLHPYVKHIHINDNHMDEDAHLPVGDGNFPWELMNSEQIRENDSSILLEVRGMEAFKKSVAYMKQNGIYPYIKA